MTRTKLLVLALGLLAIAASGQAEAVCSNARLMTTLYSGGSAYIYTPNALGSGVDNSSITANFAGDWWSLGAGDSVDGAGTDSGSFPALEWMHIYPGYPARLNTAWSADPRIDGCILDSPACAAIQLTDVDPTTGGTVFALLSAHRNQFGNHRFANSSSPITLAPIPDPAIVGVTPIGTGVAIDVAPLSAADFSGSLYLDVNAPCPGPFESYVPEVCYYSKTLSQGSPPPNDSNIVNGGWLPTGDCVGFGLLARVNVTCPDPSDAYIAYALVNESGMPVDRLSHFDGPIPCESTTGSCGDGILDPGEDCDDGNTDPGDGCDENCVLELCGNGVLQAGEECDDGNTDTGDGCDGNCIVEICGNGILQDGEECDDGNTSPGDGCDGNCIVEICGNGVLQDGEECDDGNSVNGDGCDSNCTLTACGNGIVTDPETCDDGNLIDGDGCDSNCTSTTCGNGIVTSGEECDDGNMVNGDGCDSNCTLTACGNGVQTSGEECDDGNVDDGDGCDSNCTVTACGNGIATPPEECDDGNAVDGDGCDGNCTVTGCGNGVTTPPEECDDGNTTDDDGCDGNCTFTACGNGIVTTGEECDDGNNTDGDGCQATCLLPFCGDWIVDTGEGCDDGNDIDGDGCSASCVVEGACCSDGPNTDSECFVTTPAGCAANGNSALYLGDGSACETDIDCVALLVMMDSITATATVEGIEIRWTTVSEVDTIGFRILREDAGTQGGREKSLTVVAPMIPALGNQLGGASYSHVDNLPGADDAVGYYVDDIDIFGKVTRHGPISIDRGARQRPPARGTRRP